MTFLLGFGMLFIVVYTNVKNILFPELVQISIRVYGLVEYGLLYHYQVLEILKEIYFHAQSFA